MKVKLLISILLCATLPGTVSAKQTKKKNLQYFSEIQHIYFKPTPIRHKLWVAPSLVKVKIADYDNDGILDRFDECPTVAGSPERNGCPDIDMSKIITVARPTIIFTDEEFNDVVLAFAGLQFDLGTLLADSHEGLDRFIELCKNNPKWLVSISVYVDETPDRSTNLELSEKRLNEVSAYFIRNGIDKKRISGLFFGDTMPVIDLPGTRFEVELTEPYEKPKTRRAKTKKRR